MADKFVTVVLNHAHVDYINEALDMIANYHDQALADEIGERLVDGWNNGEPLTPARKIMFDSQQAQRKKGR